MKTTFRRIMQAASSAGPLLLLSGLASGAPPTISAVYFDLSSSPGQVNIIGTNFKAGTLVRMGSTPLTVAGGTPTLVTAK